MRSLFNGYYRPTAEEFDKLWSEGTFVFDTNVLLASYLFPQVSREAFHSILSQLGSRVWIPYHVALEFQKNRIGRIKIAGRNLEDAEKALASAQILPEFVARAELEKRGVSESGLPQAIEAYTNALTRIEDALTKAKEKLPSVGLDDAIRDRLSEVFKDRIGEPPSDQAALNNLIADAEARYGNDVPPGYKDVSKSSTKKFMDRGIYYEPKHGDLIIWKQILDQIRSEKLTSVVFVTEDSKEDWWSIEGEKTLGPRPELVQEAQQAMGDSGGLFWMYSLKQFMELAGQHLEAAKVPPEAIDEVRDVSASYSAFDSQEFEFVAHRNRTSPSVEAALAVIDWISRHVRYTDLERLISLTAREADDVFVKVGSESWLLQIAAVETAKDIRAKLADLTATSPARSATYRSVVLVLSDDPRVTIEIARRIAIRWHQVGNQNFSILVGRIKNASFYPVKMVGALPPFFQ